ncbi:MAG: DUF992 domain-containing protein [Maritimibacter sp.]|nr:DUF992 domain-containing protein [Maritimibacter sp.]
MKIFPMIAALGVTAGLAAPSFAQTETTTAPDEGEGQRLGILECTIEGGWGMLLGSSKDVTCAFNRTDGSVDLYTGSLDKVGLDIGKTDKAYMTWLVLTTVANEPGDNALVGTYVGVSAGASLGIGLGVNALVGGTQDQIGLQPISVEGVEGVNLAVGLSSLTLEAPQ